jgi:TRAP-type mannitol/chloroaromatic compound transport system permease large subunit
LSTTINDNLLLTLSPTNMDVSFTCIFQTKLIVKHLLFYLQSIIGWICHHLLTPLLSPLSQSITWETMTFFMIIAMDSQVVLMLPPLPLTFYSQYSINMPNQVHVMQQICPTFCSSVWECNSVVHGL